jgi:hypothetical protein
MRKSLRARASASSGARWLSLAAAGHAAVAPKTLGWRRKRPARPGTPGFRPAPKRGKAVGEAGPHHGLWFAGKTGNGRHAKRSPARLGTPSSWLVAFEHLPALATGALCWCKSRSRRPDRSAPARWHATPSVPWPQTTPRPRPPTLSSGVGEARACDGVSCVRRCLGGLTCRGARARPGHWQLQRVGWWTRQHAAPSWFPVPWHL